MYAIDSIDCKILTLLQREGKITNTALAECVALSPSACLRRVQNLENQGIIQYYTAIINGSSVGLGVEIILTITLVGQSRSLLRDFENTIATIPNVMGCYLLGGEYDYLVHISVRDLDHYAQLHRDTLSTLPHVATLKSSFAMRQVIKRTAFDLSDIHI